jgi:hypothetical protein
MWWHSWLDDRKSVSPRRQPPAAPTRRPRRPRSAGRTLFLEPLEDRNLLSGGLSPTLVALGGATPQPIPLPLDLAANPFGGMDIYQNFQGPADANPQVTPLLGNEPNQITNFNGFYAGVRVQGTGTGHQGNEPNQSFYWDADLRVMQGTYRGVDGGTYHGTFLEV